ncbi:SEC63 [Ecytonucleospora hepatopenaei]|uniref:SEC63 n=1 Tax=Ecytonucleospora hepatopenaei TaxID=646526 RepID=A0A1W0E4P4_9MICR|nr:SEC63 [Ecytonucleospora hepatopenaei]
MFEHKYDESGLTVSYVGLTICFLMLFYVIHLFLKKTREFSCNCTKCIENKRNSNKWKIPKIFFISLLVALMAILIRNIYTLKIKDNLQAYNPYVVLGIDEFTDPKKIKKTYKKLIKKVMRRAKKEKDKKEAENTLLEINKAYDHVKNPENYRKFISAQIKTELFVAIPQFVLKFANTSFIMYMALLAVVLPIIFYFFVIKKRKTTNKGLFYETTESFYEAAPKIHTDNKTYLFFELLVFISQTPDLKKHVYKNDLVAFQDFFMEILEKQYGVDLNGVSYVKENSFLHIIDVLCRTEKGNVRDIRFLQDKIAKILESYIKIAKNQNVFIVKMLIDLERMFIQCVPHYNWELMQVLSCKMSNEILEELKNKKLKDSLENLSFLSKEDILNAEKLRQKLPVIKIENLRAFSIDTEQANAGTNGNLEKIDIENGKIFKVDRNVNSYLSFKPKMICNENMVHAPFYFKNLPFLCTVLIKVNGNISKILKISNENEIKYSLPAKTGTVNLEVKVLPCGYLGLDVQEAIKVRYV